MTSAAALASPLDCVCSVRAASFTSSKDGSAAGDVPSMGASIYRWDYNVFELAERTGGQPLLTVTMALLESQGLLDGWRLDRGRVAAYLRAVEAEYRPNPYHNNTHAADVTQTAGVIVRALDQHLRGGGGSGSSGGNNGTTSSGGGGSGGGSAAAPGARGALACLKRCCGRGGASAGAAVNGASASAAAAAAEEEDDDAGGPGLSRLERFAIVLASAVHDLGHPGLNNAFLVRTRAAVALTYNDQSVNEMMHASRAFRLAWENPELNIFEGFSPEEYDTLRRLVLEMVLSTDMDVHFALLRRYEDALAAEPDVRRWTSLPQRSLLFQMAVHLADLANPARPWRLALRWAEGIVTEFLAQGDKELALGLPVSPPCDRGRACMPAAQLFFIERFMRPTLDAFRSAAPGFYDLVAPWLGDTAGRWATFKAAGVTLPHEGYPALPQHAAPGGQAGAAGAAGAGAGLRVELLCGAAPGGCCGHDAGQTAAALLQEQQQQEQKQAHSQEQQGQASKPPAS